MQDMEPVMIPTKKDPQSPEVIALRLLRARIKRARKAARRARRANR